MAQLQAVVLQFLYRIAELVQGMVSRLACRIHPFTQRLEGHVGCVTKVFNLTQ
jgi:hypothetical protein